MFTFKDGPNSPLFRIIKKSGHLLETKDSSCTLFTHPEEVNKLAIGVKAYKAIIS